MTPVPAPTPYEYECTHCGAQSVTVFMGQGTHWATCPGCACFLRVHLDRFGALTVQHLPPANLGDDEQPTAA